MGRSKRQKSRKEDGVNAKKKGKRKVIYVDDSDYNHSSPRGKRHVSGKSLKTNGKGKGKVRYVYVSGDSESDSGEIVVKKRLKHKVVRKSRDVSSSEGDDSSSYEVVKKRKKHSKKVEYDTETSTKSDDSVDEKVEKKRKKRDCEGNEDSGKRRTTKKLVKKQKRRNDEGCSVELLPRDALLNPINQFGDVMPIEKDTYYRSNIGGAMDKLNQLEFSPHHLSAIKQTPFWYMFDAIYKKETDKFHKMCHKFESDFTMIIETYDSDVGKFSIGGKMVSVRRTDVELILGVSCGDVEIVLRDDGYTHPGWLVRCFKERIQDKKVKFVMYRNLIYLKIIELLGKEDKESIEDIARLVHCYLLASIFAPLQSGAIRWQITCFLEDFLTICTFDWSGYVVELLKAQLKASNKLRSGRCGGCTNILPYWLCEHTHIIKRESRVAFPRFLNWDLNELHKVLQNVALPTLRKVSKARLAITEAEMRHFLDIRLHRSSQQVGKERSVLHGDVAGPSNRVEVDECTEEMATAPTSEGFKNDEQDFNKEHQSTREDSRIDVSGECQNMSFDILAPLFSLGMTQDGKEISDDAGIGGDFSGRVAGEPESYICPESSNKRCSGNYEDFAADDPHLSEGSDELKLQNVVVGNIITFIVVGVIAYLIAVSMM